MQTPVLGFPTFSLLKIKERVTTTGRDVREGTQRPEGRTRGRTAAKGTGPSFLVYPEPEG